MSKFNIKVETILDGIQVKANSAGVEIVIEPVFDECTDDMPTECAAFVHNVESGRFGVVSSNVEGFDIDEVTAFAFKPKCTNTLRLRGSTDNSASRLLVRRYYSKWILTNLLALS